MKVCLVFSPVQAVVEGAFFGAGFIFLFLFDDQFGGEDFAAEVTIIEVGIVDAFIEDLELWDGKAGGQQFEEDGVQGSFVAKLAFSLIDHAVMVENEVGHFFEMEPFGVVFGRELAGVLVDVDQCKVGDADGAFDGVAVRFAEGFQLFHIDSFETGQFFEDAVSGVVEAFIGLEKTAHEGPVAALGL